MSARPRWTDDEITYLRKMYRRYGPTPIAHKLGRSRKSVTHKANKLGLYAGDSKGHTRMVHVALDANRPRETIRKIAETDGVLKRVGPPGGPTHALVVPNDWAARVIARYKRQDAGEAAARAGYVSARDAAARLGVSRGTILSALRGEGFLATHLAGVRHEHGRWDRVLFHPADLAAVRTALEKERASVRKLDSVKALAMEEGVSPGALRHRLKRRGARLRRAVVGGRVMQFVEEAA